MIFSQYLDVGCNYQLKVIVMLPPVEDKVNPVRCSHCLCTSFSSLQQLISILNPDGQELRRCLLPTDNQVITGVVNKDRAICGELTSSSTTNGDTSAVWSSSQNEQLRNTSIPVNCAGRMPVKLTTTLSPEICEALNARFARKPPAEPANPAAPAVTPVAPSVV